MIAVRGRRVLAADVERREAWVLLEGDRIVDVVAAPPRSAGQVDLGEVDLVPGLVDLHFDCLELKARPRVSMTLPLDAAVLELDAELAAWGVTTHHQCVCLEDDVGRYRSLGRARETVAVLDRLRPHLRVDHRVHLRVDVTGDGVPTARDPAEGPAVGLLSYMVHLPGLGQFPDEASWRRYYTTVDVESGQRPPPRPRRSGWRW